MIYLDYNATTPLVDGIWEVVRPYWGELFGNPSSLSYEAGRKARESIEGARLEVSRFLDADPEGVVFTSGGTESINISVLGVLSSLEEGSLVVRSAVEHPAVKEIFNFAVSKFRLRQGIIQVDKDGEMLLDEDLLKEASFVSVMLANNETGVVHDLNSIKRCLNDKCIFHSDITQAVGKLKVSFRDSMLDMCSFSAHKFGGPKGIGALLVRKDLNWYSPFTGGGQEGGRRGGTESVPLIVGLGYASKLASSYLEVDRGERTLSLRELFESEIRKVLQRVTIVGEKSSRLPNTSNILIDGVIGTELVKYLGERDICISAGSACKSSSFSASPVLAAMGYSSLSAVSGIRVSFGRENKEEDVFTLINEIVSFCKKQSSSDKLEMLFK